jgi:putative membrane protein
MLKLSNITWGGAMVAMALLGAGAACAQAYPSQPSQQPTTTSRTTKSTAQAYKSGETAQALPARTFARTAAEADLAEVKLGQLAEQNGATQTVRSFGKRMVNDHTKNEETLKNVAQQQNITLPGKLNAKDQATYDELSKLSGKRFDQAYARDMVKDHEKDVRAFEVESKHSDNDAIKNYASDTVPTLETHLRLARHMLNSVNSTHGTSAGQSGSSR